MFLSISRLILQVFPDGNRGFGSIADGYGIDPVHLGIIFLANMQIGYFTPPVGMNLFIASYRFKKPIMTLYKSTLPFFIILLVSVLIITYWPALTLTLPGR